MESRLPVALVYPNSFRVGMSNLGYQFLYHYLNSRPNIYAERFFFAWPDRRAKGTKEQPLSVESGSPLTHFPVIAFSVPFESDYPAVVGTLLAGGIPPLQKDRGDSDPIVIAGGVSVSMNPEPLASFLDLAFIGEQPGNPDSSDALVDRLTNSLTATLSRGEMEQADLPHSQMSGKLRDHVLEPGLFEITAEILADARSMDEVRERLFHRVKQMPGVYIPPAYSFHFKQDGPIERITPEPGFPERVKAVKRRSKTDSVPVSTLFTPDSDFGESLLVETNRGCSRGCRFCAAGWIHFPVRYRKFHLFKDRVESAIEEGRTVGLIGSDLAGHPDLEEILTWIVDRGGRFSLSSIRPEGLTPRIIDLLAKAGQRTATLAPETASSRMKSVIGKDIPSTRFLELVESLVSAGIPNIRFYFMVGLPTETDEDAAAIVDFVLEARERFVEVSRPMGRIGSMAIQVNPFVPKPWTPFQWTAMATAKVLEERIRIIKKGLKGLPNLKVRVESIRLALTQALLSRGDRRLTAVLLRVARQNGKWSHVLKAEGIDPELYLHRERDHDEILPWDVVDHGLDKARLQSLGPAYKE